MIQNQTLLFPTFPQATQMHKLSPYSPGAGTLQYIGVESFLIAIWPLYKTRQGSPYEVNKLHTQGC